MAFVNRGDIDCCGIAELGSIAANTPEQNVYDAQNGYACEDSNGCYLFFSDTGGNDFKAGIALAKYIKTHKLGSVTPVRRRLNPNSGNTIRMWIWGVNREALYEHKIEGMAPPYRYRDGRW